jgi:hypothetical protein
VSGAELPESCDLQALGLAPQSIHVELLQRLETAMRRAIAALD